MQVVLVVWVAVLAACYSPSFRDCALTCAAGNTCPNGLECHDNYCREPGATSSCTGDGGPDMMMIDGSPDEDTDDDGVKDDTDNCRAIPNTDQANEDGDPFGDACDRCPPYGTAADNLDSDGDMVGDGCDPHPGEAGDRLRLFVGFTEAPSVQEVLRVGQDPAWTFPNGRANVATQADNFAGLVWNVPLDKDRRFYVSSHVELLGFRASNFARGAGVMDAYSPNQETSAWCALGLNESGAPRLMLLDTALTSDAIVSQMADAAGAGGGATRSIEVYRQGTTTSYVCATPMAETGGTPTIEAGAVRIGLRARSVTAAFDWLMVVDSPQ